MLAICALSENKFQLHLNILSSYCYKERINIKNLLNSYIERSVLYIYYSHYLFHISIRFVQLEYSTTTLIKILHIFSLKYYSNIFNRSSIIKKCGRWNIDYQMKREFHFCRKISIYILLIQCPNISYFETYFQSFTRK